uniref:Uncharacterized protein n=1 Tax=Denticeps clupeoides TaxID=299321 RepID=A0AAY4ETI2_9TELE
MSFVYFCKSHFTISPHHEPIRESPTSAGWITPPLFQLLLPSSPWKRQSQTPCPSTGSYLHPQWHYRKISTSLSLSVLYRSDVPFLIHLPYAWEFRFHFHPVTDLPLPEVFVPVHKTYPSRLVKREVKGGKKERCAPPPVPQYQV